MQKNIKIASVFLVGKCVLVGLAGMTVAQAEVVNLRFSGTANLVGAPLQSYFTVGNAFTYTVSYDTAAVGSFSGDFSRTFPALSAVLEVDASGGTWVTSATNPTIRLVDSATENRIFIGADFGADSNREVGGNTLDILQFTLYSDAPGPLESFSVLPASIDLSQWSSNPSSSGVFTYWDPGISGYFMRFSVTEVENLSVVPEPATFATLCGLGALGYALSRRRTRHGKK